MIGILPICGNASRMKHIPKFLLPCEINKTLIDHIIEMFNQNDIFEIFAGVSEINYLLLKSNEKIEKIKFNTKTMSETVYNLLNSIKQSDYKSLLLMPDTYFNVSNEITKLKNMLDEYQIVVLVWKIKEYQIGKVGQCKIENNKVVDVIDKDINCNYEYFWGAIGWGYNMNKYIDPQWETIGNLIKKSIEMKIDVGTIIVESDYYDCGKFK